jgi:endonuclease/exonuclease/phosphatase family metal-dependent hydrolase
MRKTLFSLLGGGLALVLLLQACGSDTPPVPPMPDGGSYVICAGTDAGVCEPGESCVYVERYERALCVRPCDATLGCEDTALLCCAGSSDGGAGQYCMPREVCEAPDAGVPDAGTNPGTDAGTNPGTDAGTNPTTDAGTNPGTDAGTNPTTDAGTTPGADAGTNPGTDAGTNPGTDAGTNPGTDGGANPGTDAGTNPGTDAGTNPGTDAGTNPGTDAGTNPGTDAGTNPGTDGGSNPGTDGGTNPGTDGGTNPGTDGGSNPGTDGGTNPGTDAGTSVDAGTGTDAGFPRDAGTGTDAGFPNDAGTGTDAGFPSDAGTGTDAGFPSDAGTGTDAGFPSDAGTGTDAGFPSDAGTDGGTPPPAFATIRIMASNLTSGNNQSYDLGHGTRLMQGVTPDIILIQEFDYGNNSTATIRQYVTDNFGASFHYYRESQASDGIPNGIISRFPIIASGEWTDTNVPDRDYAWARIDIPGPKDLWAVSVHLWSGGGATGRNREAGELVSYIQANVPDGDYLVIGGDYNTDNHTESCLSTLSQVVAYSSAGPHPADHNNNTGTNASRAKPYDRVLADGDLNAYRVPTVIGSRTFPNGLVLDSRIYTPLSEIAPVQSGDSAATNMQHMGVVRDFRVPAN